MTRLRRTALAALVGATALVCALPASSATYDPTTDPNSLVSTAVYLGAASWWQAGYTGKGVDVAVIDSGVSPFAGL